ncbi:GntR family transcriptional regulator [Arenibaculum pallidiluteum]|uniref:GntR family transcriptional regulator n=1 Tax=Arenibaculum pallidiluteum TaxID=2812559 RepID=UPI001A95A66C|nr:GntR family transcriptional regulator [Arenibaculum pallidiluteum]
MKPEGARRDFRDGGPRSASVPAAPAHRGGKRSDTAASIIYRELRRGIASLRMKPGEAISEKEIAQTFGVSRTPVREALLRLADEGLVEIFPQSGTFVSRIPVDSLPEAIVIRKALEEAAVRYAAQRATPRQIQRLHANLLLQEEAATANDHEAFHEADEAFHEMIAETAGYPGFWTLSQQLKVQVDRYRLLTLPVPGRIPTVIAEHRAILQAIEDHDPETAARSIAFHLDSLSARIGDAQEANPFYFTGAMAPTELDAR